MGKGVKKSTLEGEGVTLRGGGGLARDHLGQGSGLRCRACRDTEVGAGLEMGGYLDRDGGGIKCGGCGHTPRHPGEALRAGGRGVSGCPHLSTCACHIPALLRTWGLHGCQ